MTTKQHDCRSVDYRFTAYVSPLMCNDYTTGGIEAATLLIDSLYEMFGNRLTIVWKDDSND